MEKIERAKLFIRMHKADLGMFLIRLSITFVFITHSTMGLMKVLPNGISDIKDISIFSLSIIELVASIMILSGFLVSMACYSLVLLFIYYTFSPTNYLYYIMFDNNDGHSFLIIAACIGIALIGPGKIVLNRRYSHIAASLRESGIDKEVEIMGT